MTVTGGKNILNMQFCGTCTFSISRLYYVIPLRHFRGNFTVLRDGTAITTDYFADEDLSVRAHDHVLNHAHCSHVGFFICSSEEALKSQCALWLPVQHQAADRQSK